MTSMHKDLVPSQLEYPHKTQLQPRDIRFRDKSWWHHVDIHSVLFHFQYISPLILYIVMGRLPTQNGMRGSVLNFEKKMGST